MGTYSYLLLVLLANINPLSHLAAGSCKDPYLLNDCLLNLEEIELYALRMSVFAHPSTLCSARSDMLLYSCNSCKICKSR